MLRSMTGYARVKKSFHDLEIQVDIQGVNKKNLDVNLRIPIEFQGCDFALRKILSQKVFRGSLNVTVKAHFFSVSPFCVQVNRPLLHALYSKSSELAEELQIAPEQKIDLFLGLLRQTSVVDIENDETSVEKYLPQVEAVLLEALDAFIQVKEKEGEYLAHDFEKQLHILQQHLDFIKEKAKAAPEKHFIRLQETLKQLIEQKDTLDERLIKEAAILAEKVDVTEELTRFQFHVNHFRELLYAKDAQPQGKLLEFILQELLRETNTIGSKAQDSLVTSKVVQLKSEIEKMREQVQNVE